MSFMTDPDAMRDYSGRFANHASNIHADAQKAFASSEGISGAGWTGDSRLSRRFVKSMSEKKPVAIAASSPSST